MTKAMQTSYLYKSGKVIAKNLSITKNTTSELATLANKLKTELLQKFPDQIKSSANVAVADVNINGIASSRLKSVSSQFTPEGYVTKLDNTFTYNKVSPQNTIVDDATGWLRDVDTEAKLLETINKLIKDSNLPNDVSGVINLHTRLEQCNGCLDVMRQFSERFPNIKLNVTWEIPYGI